MSRKMSLEVRIDLQRKELMIGFNNKEQARAYQMRNPESRIFFDASDRDVWLPMLPSMEYIRASVDGLTIYFTSEETARIWCKRSIVWYPRPRDKKEAFVQREWEVDKLDYLLRPESTGRLTPTPRKGGTRVVSPHKGSPRSYSPPSAEGSRSHN
jgi:hypothetical protein